MVVPAHNRITFSGVFGSATSPIEQWSFRLCTGPEVFADEAARVARATEISGFYTNSIQPLMRASTILTRVRVSQHLEGGLTSQSVDGQYNQGDWVGTKAGTGTGGTEMPLQTAMAVSLITKRAGSTGKGRIFLPQIARYVGTDYRYSEADTLAAANAVKGLVNAIDNAVIADGSQDDVCVVSSKGYRSVVTAVRAGRVPDTMRSRRSHLLEAYQTVQLLP